MNDAPLNVMPDERTLVLAVQDGDVRAFEPLVEAHLDFVRAFIALRLPQAHLIDELTHETFVFAFRNITEFTAGTSFRSWLRAIASNLVRAELQRFAREQHNQLGYAQHRLLESDLAAAPPEGSPEVEYLRECVEQLPSALREMVELKYAQELSIEDRAARLAAALAAPSAQYTDVATDIGGWETEIAVGGTNVTEAGFQDYLLYAPSFIRYHMDRQAGARDTNAAAGRAYKLAVYEGGPGYEISGPGRPFVLGPETYGKSLAGAVATLDTFLYNSQLGVDPQCFFSFGPGYNWASHGRTADGYHAHANWLALQMRNQHASGAMLEATINSAPAIDVPARTNRSGHVQVSAFRATPRVMPYAFRDGSKWSVFLLNRSLSNATPVTLRLPFSTVARATLHSLSGNPRLGNATNLNITPVQSALTDFKPNYTLTVPPGSVSLLVFETPETSEILSPPLITAPPLPLTVLAGATNATLALSGVTRAHDGFYNLVVANSAGAVASAPARLRVLNYTRIKSLERSPGGGVRLYFADQDGWPLTAREASNFEVWAADDLPSTNWQRRVLTLSATNGLLYFDDPLDRERRFYRVNER